MSKNIYLEQVGGFLDNELSPDELVKFNEELSRNPELVKELNFQKELVEGINANRKAELKARLDSINVGGGLSSSSISTIKVISGVVIVGAIGFAIFDFTKSSENDLTPVVENTVPVEDPELKTNEPTERNDQSETESKKETGKALNQDPAKTSVDQTQTTQPKNDEDSTPIIPEPVEAFEPTNESGTEEDLILPESILGINQNTNKSNLEVEIISNKKKYAFHYQVLDGKIVLYGYFDEEPYELLEININGERKIFLYFKEIYYSIEKDVDEITPLQTIEDDSLTTELEKIRNKDS